MIWQIPSSFKIDYVTSFLYDLEGKLKGHVDKLDGWVVLFSFGCVANFWIQLYATNRVDIKFASGDILVFNSSSQSNVLHGIDSIEAGTCPLFLPNLQEKRISIQFRALDMIDFKTREKLFH